MQLAPIPLRFTLIAIVALLAILSGCVPRVSPAPLRASWDPGCPELSGEWKHYPNSWMNMLPLESNFLATDSDPALVPNWRTSEMPDAIAKPGAGTQIAIPGGYQGAIQTLLPNAEGTACALVSYDDKTLSEKSRIDLPLAPIAKWPEVTFRFRVSGAERVTESHLGILLWLEPWPKDEPTPPRAFQWIVVDLEQNAVIENLIAKTPPGLSKLEWDFQDSALFAHSGQWDDVDSLKFAMFDKQKREFSEVVSRRHDCPLPELPITGAPKDYQTAWLDLGWYAGRFDLGTPNPIALVYPLGVPADDPHGPVVKGGAKPSPFQAHGTANQTWIGPIHLVSHGQTDQATPLDTDVPQTIAAAARVEGRYSADGLFKLYPLNAGEALCMQIVYPTPWNSSKPDAIFRFGRVTPNSTSIEWLGWIPAPAAEENERARPTKFANTRVYQSSTHWLLTMSDYYCAIPLPATATRIAPRNLY